MKKIMKTKFSFFSSKTTRKLRETILGISDKDIFVSRKKVSQEQLRKKRTKARRRRKTKGVSQKVMKEENEEDSKESRGS